MPTIRVRITDEMKDKLPKGYSNLIRTLLDNHIRNSDNNTIRKVEIIEVKTKKKNITEPIKSVIQTIEKRVKCEHYDSNCNCRLIKIGNNNLGCFGTKGDKCPDKDSLLI